MAWDSGGSIITISEDEEREKIEDNFVGKPFTSLILNRKKENGPRHF